MKKNVGILFGGYSGEAAVSQFSAINVFDLVDESIYEKYLIELDKDKNWWLHFDGDKYPRRDHSSLEFKVSSDQIVSIDVVLNMIHGQPGETGELQGYLDTIGMPYTGSNMETMVTTFNKYICNSILKKNNLTVADNYLHVGEVDKSAVTKINEALGPGPYFVKPNSGGSSLASGVARTQPELIRKINQALEYDYQVLIEQYIVGREFSIGVIEYNNHVISLPVTEIISDNEFFDYEAKYQGAVKEITPAEIDSETTDKLQDIGKIIFEIFNAKDMVRFEVIISDSNEMFILDINTIPGFTETSILPQQIKSADIKPADFINQSINRALS